MNILLVASTQGEIQGTLDFLEANWEKKSFWTYSKGDHTISSLVSGIGSIYAVFSLARYPEIGEMDYIINPGIAAALTRTFDQDRVYLVESEGFADLGLEEADGTLRNQHDLKWYDKNKHPYKKERLLPKTLHNPTFLPKCASLTVNKMPGTFENIENFQKKYYSDILTLDGAGIMYACTMLELELIQFRAIGRYVEPYQKIIPTSKKAIAQLNMRTIDIIETLCADIEEKKGLDFFL